MIIIYDKIGGDHKVKSVERKGIHWCYSKEEEGKEKEEGKGKEGDQAGLLK